jgi:hypothetical protein
MSLPSTFHGLYCGGGGGLLSGSYSCCMWVMVSSTFPSVKYLHSLICSYRLPLYVLSIWRWPLGSVYKLIYRIMSGIWCVGLCSAGSMYPGMMGCALCSLSSCNPSYCGFEMSSELGSMSMSSSFCVRGVPKSIIGWVPRSSLRVGHLPSLMSRSCCWRSLNVLWWRRCLSFPVRMQPPRICVLARGAWHFVHCRGPYLARFLHRYTCTPHATSRESLFALWEDF